MTTELIKISKPNCAPCMKVEQYLGVIKEQLERNEVKITTHDIVDEPHIIEQYGIMGVPVLIVKRDGVEISRLEGYINGPGEILAALY